MKLIVKILIVFKVILIISLANGQTTITEKDKIKNTNQNNAKSDSLLAPQKLAKNKLAWINKRFKYKVTTDGFLAKGNVNRTLFVGRGSFAYIDSVMDLSVAPVYLYGKQNGNLAEDDYSGTMYLNMFHEKRFFQWSLAIFEHSRLRGIDERHNYGGGIGCQIIKKTENQSLSITTGILYEKVNFSIISDRETWRSTTRLKGRHKVIHKHVKFAHETFVQPSILNSFDLRWRTILSLEAPISHHLSARVAYQHTYESIILPTKVKDDYNITFGLAFSN